jgi:sulfur relay (sulfurtransferase) DsrC/TusE family protein
MALTDWNAKIADLMNHGLDDREIADQFKAHEALSFLQEYCSNFRIGPPVFLPSEDPGSGQPSQTRTARLSQATAGPYQAMEAWRDQRIAREWSANIVSGLMLVAKASGATKEECKANAKLLAASWKVHHLLSEFVTRISYVPAEERTGAEAWFDLEARRLIHY